MPKVGEIAQILWEHPAMKVLLLSDTVGRPPIGMEVLRKPFEAEILRQHVRRLLLAG